MKTILVVPCYNEANRLPQEAFLSFLEANKEIGVLFVNDGSKDGTLEKLQRLEQRSNAVHVLDLQPNGGKAEAVRRGMLYAAEKMETDYIAFWDADLATPLDEVVPMVAWAGKGFDIVTGLRLMRLGAKVKRKALRHYLGRCFATVASMMLDLPVYDTQCGAKLFRREIVEPLFAEQFITRWLFDVELLARYKSLYGRVQAIEKIYEYPLFKWEDIDGSRLKKGDFVKAPVELMKIRRRYRG